VTNKLGKWDGTTPEYKIQIQMEFVMEWKQHTGEENVVKSKQPRRNCSRTTLRRNNTAEKQKHLREGKHN
jgi:hypothetical protein